MKGITLRFVPYSEIAYLSSYKRVKQLIELSAANRILLIQGKLTPEEEADLIEEVMKKIGKNPKFKGVEIATFEPSKSKNLSFFQAIKENIARALFGNRDAFTIVGPASIIKEIKKDPKKLELLLKK
ncbi:MAG TPA: DUF2073 domain-containing protein [Candidatus Pacearchaeota archaeon]|nr:DUF2073 domain-containing protein [Candidatus Pacearchaeota archaeon]